MFCFSMVTYDAIRVSQGNVKKIKKNKIKLQYHGLFDCILKDYVCTVPDTPAWCKQKLEQAQSRIDPRVVSREGLVHYIPILTPDALLFLCLHCDLHVRFCELILTYG